jgi:hypothetical protein
MLADYMKKENLLPLSLTLLHPLSLILILKLKKLRTFSQKPRRRRMRPQLKE